MEEKERRKAEKKIALKNARAIAHGEVVEDDAEEDGEGEGEGEGDEEVSNGKLKKKDLNVGADSIASLGAKVIKGELKPRPRLVSEQEKGTKEGEEEREEEEVPVLINRDLPTLQSVLEKADVMLEVVDARDPMVFRSEHVENLVKDAGKKVLLVLNKIGGYSLFLAWFFLSGLYYAHSVLLFFRHLS